jgi:TatD DNase family protein
MWEIGLRHPGVLFQMLGLYPGSVDANWREELDALEPYKDKGIVAIGEIGLDYHEGLEFVQEQKEVLRLQLELAAAMNLPVNIHLRDAWEDLLSILADCKHLNLRGNLHCFTSSYEIFERANRYGDFSVGIGGVVTFKNASIAKTLERIPLEKILLETDAPYLAPVPYRGRRNESSFLPYVAAKVAEIKGIPVEEVEAITTTNALKLFNI